MSEDSGVWVKVHPDYAGGGEPGAAVIGGATGAVTESSFTGDASIPGTEPGQAYDVYEFWGSGELTVTQTGVVTALIIGGGAGASSYYNCGGGGAGGVLYSPYVTLDSEVPQVVVVDGGGAGGDNGHPSRLGLHFSPGGGRGPDRGIGINGGSGGGGGGDNNANNPGGAGWQDLGNNGGAGYMGVAGSAAGGGGGGAGAAGSNATSATDGGKGGDGREIFITGESVWYGGGGGGSGTNPGAGGRGGGGAGINAGPGTSGEENTGGGGGGGRVGGTPPGAQGGSGIVVVRVPVATPSFGLKTRTTAPRTAHAARVENGVVRQVIVIPHLDDDDNKITEYCNKIGLPGTWVDTSYTGARRGKYAGVGDLFDLNTRNAEFTSPVEVTE